MGGSFGPIVRLFPRSSAVSLSLLPQTTSTRAGPLAISPITHASAKPSARNSASTSSTASGAHDTSSPPDVCGSVSSARPVGGNVAGSTTSWPYASQLRPDAPVKNAGLGEARDVRQPRQVRVAHPRGQLRAAREFQRMAEQAEAGDVGQRMHAVEPRQFGARAVELGGRADHRRIAGRVEPVLLQRRGQNADAERLAEDQHVAGLALALRFTRFGSTTPIATRP